MAQSQTLQNQSHKLDEARKWLRVKIRFEEDKQVRDLMFRAEQSISLTILQLDEIEYRTGGAYNQEDK